jgi:hypothetical protein
MQWGERRFGLRKSLMKEIVRYVQRALGLSASYRSSLLRDTVPAGDVYEEEEWAYEESYGAKRIM